MDFLSDPNFCVLKPITYYVCPAGQTVANYDGDGLNTSVTPSDSNDGLTKATPLATIAAAAAKIAGKVLLAPVTIQLADTDATLAYFPDNIEFSNPCAGAPFSSILERAITGRLDTYPTAYVHIKGNTSTPNNVNVTGAATYNGTTSTTDCAFVARGTNLRTQGFKCNYFRAADGDTGAITGYRSVIYAETLNATSDHTGNDGHLVSGFFQSVIMLGGSFNVTNSGFVSAHAGSVWQTYSPLGYASGNLSKSGTGFMMFTNEFSHGFFQGGTWTFGGSGTYYAQAAWTNSSINWNGDATTSITYNGANITGLYASQRSVIHEGAGVNMTVTLTSILRRAHARNGSHISYGGTTAGSSADLADGASSIANGSFPFITKLVSKLEGFQSFGQISAPGTVPSNEGYLYVKDVSGTTGLFFKDDGQTETQLGAGGGGGDTLPIVDTTAVVKGSADATKLLRFEVDGFTTGTTRVITPPNSNTTLPIASQVLTFAGPTAARTITFPDASITVARSDAANTFLGAQTVEVNAVQPMRLVRTGTGQTQFAITSGGSNAWESAVFNAERWNGSTGTPSVLSDGMDILAFNGAAWQSGSYNGGSYSQAGTFLLEADGAHGSGSTPGRWSFLTTPSGSTSPVERLRISANGNVVVGNSSSALSTSATSGFLYVPTCAGTPTGSPTAVTGAAPIVIDTTNNKLYFRSGGAWRDAGP